MPYVPNGINGYTTTTSYHHRHRYYYYYYYYHQRHRCCYFFFFFYYYYYYYHHHLHRYSYYYYHHHHHLNRYSYYYYYYYYCQAKEAANDILFPINVTLDWAFYIHDTQHTARYVELPSKILRKLKITRNAASPISCAQRRPIVILAPTVPVLEMPFSPN